MTAEEYKQKFKEDQAVGWLAIDEALSKVYGQIEPRHYPPLCGLHYMAGGTDPLDGASVFDSSSGEFHRHIIGYGLSELYHDPEKAGGDFSKWGFEFTMRLKPFAEDKNDPLWAVHVMNNLARYVISSRNWFEENQIIPANGPVRKDTDTAITAFLTALDPELGKIQSPHGELSFIQLVGITTNELEQIIQDPTVEAVQKFLEEMKKTNPLLITDLTRR
jgi:hypothetical protein